MQTGAGLLGNFFLLYHFTITLLTGNRLRPIDAIFSHLALANFIVLTSKGVPQTMVSLGLKFLLDRVGCRIIIFLHRVSRSLSVNITCLLSGFQITSISSNSSSLWSKLKTYTSKYIFHFCLCCWILHILINMYMLVDMKSLIENHNNTRRWNLGFCSDFSSASFEVSLYIIVYCIADFMCIGFMVMTSAYLVLFLQRHHQQVQHIHSFIQSKRRSPAIRATCTILVLVSTYVIFYTINSIFSFYLFHFEEYHQWLMPTTILLDACFPAISPFVLISGDSQILHFFYSLW
ncbi:vomeronasal type-1 receptor 1-like [Macrotis lagotis]|uniref:vomeronasal type-1 receptor 1-like n=1 Tax=Macrotis lagotis TaxID=92651 RepID=UPI003D689DBF